MGGWRFNSFVFTVSREQAIMFGHEEPTPEEVAAYNADSRKRWQESVEQWARLDTAAASLLALADPLARKVLDLHSCATSAAECVECSEYDDESYPMSWPCETVALVADHFGVELPDGYFGSRPGDAPHEMPPEGYTPFLAPLARWYTADLADAFDATVLHGEEK